MKIITDNPRIAYQCDTREKDNEYRKKMHDIGQIRCNGESYIDYSYWKVYKEETCYIPFDGLYGSKKYIEERGYIIIPYELDIVPNHELYPCKPDIFEKTYDVIEEMEKENEIHKRV